MFSVGSGESQHFSFASRDRTWARAIVVTDLAFQGSPTPPIQSQSRHTFTSDTPPIVPAVSIYPCGSLQNPPLMAVSPTMHGRLRTEPNSLAADVVVTHRVSLLMVWCCLLLFVDQGGDKLVGTLSSIIATEDTHLCAYQAGMRRPLC